MSKFTNIDGVALHPEVEALLRGGPDEVEVIVRDGEMILTHPTGAAIVLRGARFDGMESFYDSIFDSAADVFGMDRDEFEREARRSAAEDEIAQKIGDALRAAGLDDVEVVGVHAVPKEPEKEEPKKADRIFYMGGPPVEA
jgi:hypothetical protein